MELWKVNSKREWDKKNFGSFLAGSMSFEKIIEECMGRGGRRSKVLVGTGYAVFTPEEEAFLRRVAMLLYSTEPGQDLLTILNNGIFPLGRFGDGTKKFVLVADEDPKRIGAVRIPEPDRIPLRLAYGLNLSQHVHNDWHITYEPKFGPAPEPPILS